MDVRAKSDGDLMWNNKKWGVLEWMEFLLRVVVASIVVVLAITYFITGGTLP